MKDYTEILREDDFFITAELGVNYYDIANKENISLMEAAKLMIDHINKKREALKLRPMMYQEAVEAAK